MPINSKVRNFFRITGAAGAPTDTLSTDDKGVVAINFKGHVTGDGTTALYSWDGTAWFHINKSKPVTTQVIDLTAAGGANPGAGWTASGKTVADLTGTIIIATHGTPTPSAYLLTDDLHPDIPASWTPLGSSMSEATILHMIEGKFSQVTPKTGVWTTNVGGVPGKNKLLVLSSTGLVPFAALPWADKAAVIAGTDPHVIVSPLELRNELMRLFKIASKPDFIAGVITTDGSGTPKTGQLVKLGSNNKIASNLLSIAGLNFHAGDLTVTVPDPTHHANGDVIVATKDGTPHASWNFPPDVEFIKVGDMAIYDGTAWHHMATAADLSHVVFKTHTNTMLAAADLLWPGTAAKGHIIIDGGNNVNAVIQKVTMKETIIDCGSF